MKRCIYQDGECEAPRDPNSDLGLCVEHHREFIDMALLMYDCETEDELREYVFLYDHSADSGSR
jgi:hypothetical protein